MSDVEKSETLRGYFGAIVRDMRTPDLKAFRVHCVHTATLSNPGALRATLGNATSANGSCSRRRNQKDKVVRGGGTC